MTFTDDNLKRLKFLGDVAGDDIAVKLPKGQLQALIARLEAAERVCMVANQVVQIEVSHKHEHHISALGDMDALYFEWRKAAGK